MPRGYEEDRSPRRPSAGATTPSVASRATSVAQEWPAVFGSTEDNPERHFLGWLGDVDPDELFASGEAWGLTVVRTRVRALTRRSARVEL